MSKKNVLLMLNVLPQLVSLELRHLYTLSLPKKLFSTHDAHLALNLSSSVADLQKVHARLIRSNLYSVGFLGDRLVSHYAKYRLSIDALHLFDEIPVKDLASWNSAISSLFQCGACEEGLSVFRRLLLGSSLRPNGVTVISILPYCAHQPWLNVGRCVHGFVEKSGLSFDVKVLNSLVNMYGKCGAVEMARALFDTMTVKSSVTWNSLLAICASNGWKEEAFGLYDDMRRSGLGADRATVLSLVHGCTSWGAARLGKAVHACTLRTGFGSDVPIATSIMQFYAKTGDLSSSCMLFYEIDHPDILAWTTMIAGYAVHGQGREAIDVFLRMINVGKMPDHVTFTHVLSACSHSGLVQEGRRYFNVMIEDYGIQPTVEHYSCLVDLLGRAGLLTEARQLIESMPIEPNSGVWGALLASCRLHHDIQLGKEAAEKLFALNPLDPNNYIVLFNMFSREGMWYEASKIRSLMKERGLRKDPGSSFIEHENLIVRFVVGDRSHPLSNEMYAKLEELTHKMCIAGYVPITDYVLHDVDKEMKEHMVGIHSEKLAIAFGLLVIADGAPIVILKNLRICGDCHLATKFISAIEKRTLIIRDSKRFHHFADGKCSCGDYW